MTHNNFLTIVLFNVIIILTIFSITVAQNPHSPILIGVSAATNPKTGNNVLPDSTLDPVVAESSHVLLLFDDNFEQEIAKYEYVLVHFYASWGGIDAPLGATLSEAAEVLSVEKEFKPNTVKIAQIEGVVGDSKSEPSVMAQKYHVQGFPTIKLFFEGNFVQDYSDEENARTAEEIAEFLKDKATKIAIT